MPRDAGVAARTCHHPRRKARQTRALSRLTAAVRSTKHKFPSPDGKTKAETCIANLAKRGIVPAKVAA